MTWVKGTSGNPKGRPKRGNAMTMELQKILRMKDEDGVTNRAKIAQALFEAAMAGNVKAIEDIYDRMDGKVEQKEEHNQDGTITHIIKVTYEDSK